DSVLAQTDHRQGRDASHRSGYRRSRCLKLCEFRRAQAASLSVGKPGRSFTALRRLPAETNFTFFPNRVELSPIELSLQNVDRSNHRERKDHKVGGEEETTLSKVRTDPNFLWRICRLLSVFPRHTVTAMVFNLIVT